MVNNNKNSEILNDEQSRKLTDEELKNTNGGIDITSCFKKLTSSLEHNREGGIDDLEINPLEKCVTNLNRPILKDEPEL